MRDEWIDRRCRAMLESIAGDCCPMSKHRLLDLGLIEAAKQVAPEFTRGEISPSPKQGRRPKPTPPLVYSGGSVSNERVGWKLLRLDEASGASVTKERSQAPRRGYKRGDKIMARVVCQL
jgi:hypothetical protein